MVLRMSWRSKRGGGKAEQALEAATIARVTREDGSREAGESAVRGVLARAELERPIETVVIVALDDSPLAEELGSALRADREIVVSRVEGVELDQADAAFAVVSASMPARTVVDALDRLDSILLGVVLADDTAVPESTVEPQRAFDAELAEHAGPTEPPPDEEPGETAAALDALAELERATGQSGLPPVVLGPSPVIERPAETAASADELASRLARLTHREAALRRVTEAVEQQRARLAEQERALERRERALEERESAPPEDDERLEEAVRRAEDAERRVRELEERVADLATRLESATTRPAVSPTSAPPSPGAAHEAAPPPVTEPSNGDDTYHLRRLEHLVRDAELRGDPSAEEWAYYLPLLREHADAEGHLPREFHTLVDSVFGI
jgi:hypothetical protein